ncbi:MAG TPA: hypothetical protein VLX44_02990 [Xanthobacteraceae bacterium]|nr:hypothetical protein [Xanthobacteraceae bacterium]
MTLFDALAIALSLLPAMMTVAALAWWWRTLERRALFGVTSFFALVGIEYLFRRVAIPVPMMTSGPASGGGDTFVSNDVEAVLFAVFRLRTRSYILAILLLLIVGTLFLAWLRRAFRPC